jgi:hypothetical protein
MTGAMMQTADQEAPAMTTQTFPQDLSDVVIVPAGPLAYPEYLKHHWYVCQGGRAFRPHITHIGFYANGAIQPHLARIRYREDGVTFTHDEVARRQAGSGTDQAIGQIIASSLRNRARDIGMTLQVFLLSPLNDRETVHLARPILNDSATASGRRIAWARNQRYSSVARLTAPGVKVTSQLGGA